GGSAGEPGLWWGGVKLAAGQAAGDGSGADRLRGSVAWIPAGKGAPEARTAGPLPVGHWVVPGGAPAGLVDPSCGDRSLFERRRPALLGWRRGLALLGWRQRLALLGWRRRPAFRVARVAAPAEGVTRWAPGTGIARVAPATDARFSALSLHADFGLFCIYTM